MNKRRLLLRLLSSPAVLFIILVAHNYFVIKRFIHFLRWGGEYINFEKNEKPTIETIYKLLKEQNKL